MKPECFDCPVALFCVTGTRIIIGGCYECRQAKQFGFRYQSYNVYARVDECDRGFVQQMLECAGNPGAMIGPTSAGFGGLCPECARERIDIEKRNLVLYNKNRSD